jgi:hypothetical protein
MATSTGKRTAAQRDEEDAAQAAPAVAKDALTAAEERLLCRHWELQTLAAGSSAKLPRAVTGTAVVFQKRFWLSTSPCEFKPSDVMAASLFLAIKVHGDPHLEVAQWHRALGETLGAGAVDMAARESDLMLGLRFHLTVYHPYGAIRGIIHRCSQAAPLDPAVIGAFVQRCLHFADISLTSDAPLLFTPAQLACACVIIASEAHPSLSGPLGAVPDTAAGKQASDVVSSILEAAQADTTSAASSSAASAASAESPASVLDRCKRLVLQAAAALDISGEARKLDRRRRATISPAFAEEGAGAAARKAAMRKLEAERQALKAAQRAAEAKAATASM